MAMLPSCLKRLFLTDIPSLVELPSFIQNFSKLDHLGITDCINLETLPTGINFQYLYCLDFKGCTRLKTFPDISTNIRQLCLAKTGIEEVPSWIEKFSRLKELILKGCRNLRRVSLSIYKIKELEFVDLSDFGALAECSWTDNPREGAMATDSVHPKLPSEASSSLPDEYFQNVEIIFKCFNLDPETILHQRSIIFTELRMLGEEVPSYFTHRTTGTSSLTIPLLDSSLSQPFFRYRACAVVSFDSVPKNCNRVFIHVDCRFKGGFGNNFDSLGEQVHFVANKKDSHLFIIDYRIPINKDNMPLAQMNYDQVDMQLHISNKMNFAFRQKVVDKPELRQLDNSRSDETKFKLKGWGIRLVEDGSLHENQLGHPNTLPLICELDGENKVNENEHEDELEESCVDTERKGKRIRIT